MAIKAWHVFFVGTSLVVAVVGLRYLAKPVPVAASAAASTTVAAPVPQAETVAAPTATTDGNAASNTARAVVAHALAPIEAYSADHDGYTGMTRDGLSLYDRSLSKDLVVRSASPSSYCVEASVDGHTFSKSGPTAEVVSGAC